MAYSKQTLIAQIRALLDDNPWHDSTTAAFSPVTTGTTATVADTTLWSVGDILETQDDGELMLVTALPTSTTMTVIRNYNFSITTTSGTGTTHASGADVTKNPVFRYSQIVNAIATVLRSLWPNVYVKILSTVTPVAGTFWYKVDADTLALSSVIQKQDASRVRYYGTPDYPVKLGHNLPSGFPEASTTAAIYFRRFDNTTYTIAVNGIARINDDVTSGSYDDLAEGIESETVMYLAAADLVAKTDIARSTQEDTGLGDSSVSPGARSSVGDYWRRKGEAAKYRWVAELRENLPRMGRW